MLLIVMIEKIINFSQEYPTPFSVVFNGSKYENILLMLAVFSFVLIVAWIYDFFTTLCLIWICILGGTYILCAKSLVLRVIVSSFIALFFLIFRKDAKLSSLGVQLKIKFIGLSLVTISLALPWVYFILNLLLWMNIQISSTAFYISIEKDNHKIKYHWDNDSDLLVVNKILFTFKGIMMLVLFYNNFNCNIDISLIVEWLPVVLFVFISICVIEFLATCHIILYRNPVMGSKGWQICKPFIKARGFIGVALFFYADFLSNCLVVEPNHIIRFYHKYSPNGRGFGMENQSCRIQLILLQKLFIFTPNVVGDLIDKRSNNVTIERIDEYKSRPEIKSKIFSELSVLDC